jgi:hypothetical protein
VFAAVARESATWLCVPLLPYGPAGALADRVDGLRYLHLHTDREHALAALGPPVPADSAIRADLPFSLAALNLARDLAARACQDWGMVPHCGEVELIVSELVANALRHADPPLRLVVARRGPDLQIVVRDGSSLRPDPPARTGPSRLRDRGLQLIDAFATVWGSIPTLGGKAVWATLRT